ncbi:MAG: hypothetical protein E7012_02520 [Alphaproteobacteria bacterium]|nr:hypothetical protein [Alphaproteobacteria bacterium]
MKLFLLCSFVCSCTLFSKGDGQVVFHWERPNTGVEKFSRDHAACLIEAKDIQFIPDFHGWFYTEEVKLDTRADWKSDKGIWASYIPYAGAQPLIVNSRHDDQDIDPAEYRDCMENLGYYHRFHHIPEITNINVYHNYEPFWW